MRNSSWMDFYFWKEAKLYMKGVAVNPLVNMLTNIAVHNISVVNKKCILRPLAPNQSPL